MNYAAKSDTEGKHSGLNTGPPARGVLYKEETRRGKVLGATPVVGRKKDLSYSAIKR